MGTPHNRAEVGDIAEKILLPGDPLRAKFIAENFLENAVCYNDVRGCTDTQGFTRARECRSRGPGWECRPCISMQMN